MNKTNMLRLSVKSKNWRMNDDHSESSDAEFQIERKKVLDRDSYTCQLCGFKSMRWQEVHHINDDHSDNRKENLMTICSYCHMCQHIGLAGRNEEATLIWLPEIDQDKLHHLVRTIQIAKRWADTATMARNVRSDVIRTAKSVSEGADSLMSQLKERSFLAEEKLGTNDLTELANIMLHMPDDLYEKRGDFLFGFKMLPLGVRKQNNDDIMTKMVDCWLEAGGPYVNLRPTAWLGLFKSSVK